MVDVIDDCRADCECARIPYCPLRNLVESISERKRFIEQHTLVRFYRWTEGEKEKKEISWDEIYRRWIDKGLAKRFAEVYSEEKDYFQMRKELFGV